MMLIFAAAGVALGWQSPNPVSRNITVKARQYAYNPPVIKVNVGDTLNLKLVSLDVVHGFYLEGYNLDARITANTEKFEIKRPKDKNSHYEQVEAVTVVADKRGKFRYRCSHTCGSMHPFMQGELIVEPNARYHGAVGGLIGLFMGMIWMLSKNSKKIGKNADSIGIEENETSI